MKTFEFVPGDEIVIAPGRTVKRIRAAVAIVAMGVVPGQLGGYVEHEFQVSDNAWVYDNARIFGNARIYDNAIVSDNAWVYDNALVSGNAQIFGNALVYGNAQVYGDTWVSGDARVSGNALVSNDQKIWWASKVGIANGTLTAYKLKDGSIELTRGCFRGSIDEFLSKSEKDHDDTTHIEYRMLIEVAVSRLTRFD